MYNFLPPTLTHLSRNQQGPQKIWKDWPRLALYSIAKGGNDMLANSLWSNREMGPRLPSQIFILYREVKYCQTSPENVIAHQDWNSGSLELLVKSPLRKSPSSQFPYKRKPNFKSYCRQVAWAQINMHSVASWCQLAWRCNHFTQHALHQPKGTEQNTATRRWEGNGVAQRSSGTDRNWVPWLSAPFNLT